MSCLIRYILDDYLVSDIVNYIMAIYHRLLIKLLYDLENGPPFLGLRYTRLKQIREYEHINQKSNPSLSFFTAYEGHIVYGNPCHICTEMIYANVDHKVIIYERNICGEIVSHHKLLHTKCYDLYFNYHMINFEVVY